MAAPAMLYLRRVLAAPAAPRANHQALGRQEQLLLDSGRIFMLLGALVLTWQAASPLNTEHVFVAFLLWLFGIAAAMLSLVARHFPGLAAAGAAVAAALRNYLLGGL